MRKNLIWITGIILIAVLFGVFVTKSGDKAKKRKGSSGESSTGLEHQVMTFSIDGRSPKGVKQWHLDGESAEIVNDDIHLKNLKAVAYGEEATVNLTSDSGIYRKEKGEVELIGNVFVTSDKDFTLRTDKARWSQNTKKITTKSPVQIDREGMRATGTGGMANSEEKYARLDKDVKVNIEPDTVVKSSGPLEVKYSDNIAVFHDDVMVEDKDGRLFADMLTVEFDTETQQLARVIAEGHVKVKRGRSYTMSEKAIYTDSTKSAKLLGRPRLIIDPGELSKLDNYGREDR